jgi:hypothetical protein
MKTNFVLASIFAALALTISAAAQDKVTNFSGTWTLDVSKSKLGDRNMIESQTLTVAQTDKDIKIETATKRTPPPADAPQGEGRGRGRMGGMMGGDMPVTYTLDGKETKTEMSGPMGSMPVSLKAKWDGGKLKLSRSSSFSGPMGDVTITSNETWDLSGDGKTLTVNVERSTPRGNESATKVFTKKS